MKKIITKIIFTALLVLGLTNVANSQTTVITNPVFRGTVKFDTTLITDGTGGLNFSTPIFITDYLKIGNSTIEDSASFTIFNRTPIFYASGWLNSKYLGDTSVSGDKIKSGVVSTRELSSGLKDSIFTGVSIAGLSNSITNLKSDFNVLFNDNGNFKSTIMSNGMLYDSALHQLSVKIDTASMRFNSGVIESRLADVYDFTTNSFNDSITIGGATIKSLNGNIVSDSISANYTFYLENLGGRLYWRATDNIIASYPPGPNSGMNFTSDAFRVGESIGTNYFELSTGGLVLGFDAGSSISSTTALDMFGRYNYKDTVDFDGSVVLNFPTLDEVTLSTQLNLGVSFDGSTPGDLVVDKYIKVWLNGVEYRIAAYIP